MKPVNPKGNQPWIFSRGTDAEAEVPILWPRDVNSQLIGKDPDAGRNWGQEEKGTIEDKMAGWHHWLDGCESEWTPGVGDGQGGQAGCDSWSLKESDTTEYWTELNVPLYIHVPHLLYPFLGTLFNTSYVLTHLTSHQPCETDVIISPVLQMMKLRHTKG